MIEINNLEEMKPYYNEETRTYIFNDEVRFHCNLSINKNINADDINAWDINALDMGVMDINARNIDANNIRFFAICCAYETLKCKSIKGSRKGNKIICLDNDIEIKGEEK